MENKDIKAISEAETVILPRDPAPISLKAGRRYMGETGRITNPIQWNNMGGYFRSWDRDTSTETEDISLFGRWLQDGTPVNTDPDSTTQRNFGCLISEVAP